MGEPVHSPLPWAYRSQPHDDWGVIRAPTNEKGWTPVVAIARGVEGDGRSHDDHFRARTDPYEANGRLIVDRVNGWDALAAERDALQARVREAEALLTSIKRHGELGNVGTGGWQGNKPAGNPMSKDVWQFPRHMLVDLDAFLSSSTGADHD